MRSAPSELSIEWPPSIPMSDAIFPFLKIRSTSSAVERQLERLRILAHHPMDDVDLLERGGDGGLSLQLAGHVDRPELRRRRRRRAAAGCRS